MGVVTYNTPYSFPRNINAAGKTDSPNIYYILVVTLVDLLAPSEAYTLPVPARLSKADISSTLE